MRFGPASLSCALPAALFVAAVPVVAQNTSAPPERTYLPGLEKFSLPPANGQQPRPAPPAAQATPEPAPPRPAASATPAPVTPRERPAARRDPRAIEAAPDNQILQRQIDRQAGQLRNAPPTVAPAPAPGGIPTTARPPVATPATPPSVATPAPAVPADTPAVPVWLWAMLGAALALGAGLFAWRRRGAQRGAPAAAPVPARKPVAEPVGPPARLSDPAAAQPSTPARPAAAPPAAAPLPPATYSGPLSLEFRPLAIRFEADTALLDFELVVINTGTSRAEGLRATIGMMAANPQQDELIAAFHHTPAVQPAGPPVTLAPGERHRIAGALAMAASGIHVVELAGRPMFVPIALIDLRWQAGLSLRRDSVDFMIGPPAKGGKLGPVWLDDRRARFDRLAATRYVRRAMPAAAE